VGEPFKMLDMLCNHPLTAAGLVQFLNDWNKALQDAPVAF
jgi:hypothetical protein